MAAQRVHSKHAYFPMHPNIRRFQQPYPFYTCPNPPHFKSPPPLNFLFYFFFFIFFFFFFFSSLFFQLHSNTIYFPPLPPSSPPQPHPPLQFSATFNLHTTTPLYPSTTPQPQQLLPHPIFQSSHNLPPPLNLIILSLPNSPSQNPHPPKIPIPLPL